MIDLIERLNHLKNNEKFNPNSFLDVGANFGNYSKMIKDIWPNTDVFMIDANPYNEKYLKNTGYNYIISLLTDKIDETYDFYLNKTDINSTGCSIYRENTTHFSNEKVDIIKLKSNTLDNLFIDRQFDLIKLDTQGSEIDILKGGLNLISKAKYIIIEASIVNYNLNAPLIDDVLNFMTSVNYKMTDIIELHYLNDILIQVDILFKNSNKNNRKNNMITIFQADKNYKNHADYDILKNNLNKLQKNGNNYYFYVDDVNWISYVDLKIIKLLDLLKKYDDDEIIMYIDALDTSVEALDSEIVEKFLAFDADVVYSCEKGVWPNPNFSKFFPDNYFLNSGTIIFKNKKYQQILEMLIEIAAGRLIYNCDQYYHTMFVMIALSDIKIKLDKSSQIFQCLVDENENDYQLVNNRIKNTTTNNFPCVFHGNGTDGRKKIRNILGYEIQTLSFLGFTDNKMGINFMNSSSLDKIKVYAEIKNAYNQIIYSNYLDLTYNISYFISTGINDNCIFTIYDIDRNILLQEKNY